MSDFDDHAPDGYYPHWQDDQPSDNLNKVGFLCDDGFEHKIGQNYDERRGVGNGPQICLRCKTPLTTLINNEKIEAVNDALAYQVTPTASGKQADTPSSGAYHDGYRDGYQTAKHEALRKFENENYQ